jgi:phage terminase large subunit GpA-like protein
VDYERSGNGGLMRLSRVLVDSGKWPGVIAAVKHKAGAAAMSLAKGIGIRAGNRPMSSFKRKQGERFDPYGHWYMPATQGTREFPHVAIDVNYWKSFLHAAFIAPPGDPGALTLFGSSPETHTLCAAHMTAETFVETQGHGRTVQEWTIRPQRPDNHWLDALNYATCAASVQGITVPNRKEPPRQGVLRRQRMSVDQMMMMARGANEPRA